MQVGRYDSRRKYFDGVGTEISGCQKSEQAIKLAGLDFEVEKQPIYLADGTVIDRKFANVRTDTNEVLGVVGENYNIVQNKDGFEFLDSIIGTDCVYETAGSLRGGKTSFMLAKTEPIKILGDDFDPYMLFTNSFDGSGTVQAMFTPIRVYCSNTLALALKNAENKISIKHASNVKDELEIAKQTLLLNSKYLENLKQVSEQLAVTPFNESQVDKAVHELIPIKLDSTDNRIEKQERAQQEFWNAYNQDDLQNYNNSALKFIQAVADYDSHKQPGRITGNDAYTMLRVVGGMLLLNQAAQIVRKQTGVRF